LLVIVLVVYRSYSSALAQFRKTGIIFFSSAYTSSLIIVSVLRWIFISIFSTICWFWYFTCPLSISYNVW